MSWENRAATGCRFQNLLIAACAQQHQAAVLHLDRHYDVLTGVLAFEAVRLDR